LGTTQDFADWVGSTDTNDYYQFTLTKPSSVDFQLDGVVGTTYLYLLNAAGTTLVNDYANATTNGTLIDSLGPGTYYIDVVYEGTNTGYNLSATATVFPGQAGATTLTAEAFGTLTASGTTASDYVGSTDPADYYSFTLSGPSILNLTLSGLGQSASVELLNAAGQQITYSSGSNTGNASLIDPLAAGNYFAEVYSGSGGTTYSLSASATALPVIGGTLTTAYNITTGLNEGPLPDNYSATGRSDVLLQNTNGTIDIFTTSASGLALPSAVSAGDPGSTWHVVATADLDGDGQPDLLLQNDNGTLLDFLMNGTSITAGYDLGSAGSSWHVRGTGDFSGDGNNDILLQSDSGSMVLFETNGQALIASSALGSLPAGWAVEGVGDFYGTGQPDILVQSNNGTLVLYTMSGTTITSGAVIGTPGASYSVAGIGDYNGDGKADILLHNDNGVDIIWEMNGPTVTGGVFAGNPGAGYTAAVTGIDLNGDGASDLVVQNTATSTLVGYTLNDTAGITAGAVLGTPGAGWNVVGSNPTTFIDGTGSKLALTGTPGPDQFNLISYAAGIHTISSFDPAQDTLALSAAAFPSYATVKANEATYLGGTFINLSPTAAIVIQGVTPSQLSAANFVLR